METRPKDRRPWVAGALSFFVPGLGQIYNGQWLKGLAVFGAELLLGYAVAFGFSSFQGLLFGLFCLVLFLALAAHDAVAVARRTDSYRLRPCNRIWLYLLFTCLSLSSVFLLDWYLSDGFYQTFRVPTPSMASTILPGDKFMARRMTPSESLRRKDVVIFHPPGEEVTFYVKRVVALPGEMVSIRDGRLFVNGRNVQEPYARFGPMKDGSDGDVLRFKLGPDEYWLMGDNRPMSWDSRFFGPVRRERIGYKALYIYLPSFAYGGNWGDRVGSRLD